MTVLVDSWGWIEYFNGSAPGEKVRELIENPREKVIVSSINIAEVYNSFLRNFPYPDNERLAEASREAIRQRSYIFEVNVNIAFESARLKHKMKWGLGDCIVYATAKRESAKLLTGDPHFKDVKDVVYLGK